jgi:hypothetical protein
MGNVAENLQPGTATIYPVRLLDFNGAISTGYRHRSGTRHLPIKVRLPLRHSSSSMTV